MQNGVFWEPHGVTSQKTPFLKAETVWLLLFREIIALYSKNHTNTQIPLINCVVQTIYDQSKPAEVIEFFQCTEFFRSH
jgi:hypothetical protein